MVRIYRYILVAILIALITWGVWYVVSSHNKKDDYEDGVLVREEAWYEMKEAECRGLDNYDEYSLGKAVVYGARYSIY